MTITIRRFARTAATLSALGFAALILTGCSQELTIEEVQASPERVVETSHDFWDGKRWGYVSPEGDERALSEDCSEFLSGACWTDPDHTVEFHYSRDKHGNLLAERLVLNGVEREADCASTDFWAGVLECAPIPAESE